MVNPAKLAVPVVEMVRVAVMPRHTVITGSPPRPVGPGTLLTLPISEAQHLIAAGFVFDPQGELDRLGTGAVFRKAR
jgi:hypothetical protein